MSTLEHIKIHIFFILKGFCLKGPTTTPLHMGPREPCCATASHWLSKLTFDEQM